MRLAVAMAILLAGTVQLHAQDAKPVEADIIGITARTVGKLSLSGNDRIVVARIVLEPGTLTPGWHGVHFHAVADCSDTAAFEKSKAHVNHGGAEHGLLNPKGPDNGDLPNVFAAADGSVNAEVASALIGLTGDRGLLDADGSAFIIHANTDDHMSQPIGGAGDRVACAEIKK